MTMKFLILLFVGLTTVHFNNFVGGFFFASSNEFRHEQQLPQHQLTSSAEINDAFGGGSLTTMTTFSMKSEQFMLEQRLADVRFHFN